jgi:hydrogenase maturation protease
VSALVVGYGSDLRGDDAVGRRVAEEVGVLAVPGVEVRSVHQLTPELAVDLAGREVVVFVDADLTAATVAVTPLESEGGQVGTTHHVDPRGLLTLAELLGAPPVAAVVVSVPAWDLGLGESLSAPARAQVPAAVQAVVEVLRAVGRRASAT